MDKLIRTAENIMFIYNNLIIFVSLIFLKVCNSLCVFAS